MKLNCSVTIVNHFATSLGVKSSQKFKNATLAIMKPSKEDVIYLLLITSKNKSGTRYKIKDNVEKIFSQFVNEGKSTIRFKEPPHDLMIIANNIQLKNFLLFLKKVCTNEVKNVPEISKITIPQVKTASTNKMEIKTKSEYPILKGFPTNLQVLIINNCHLKRIDNRIMKLKNLTSLYLDRNNLTNVPVELQKLPLKYLSLSQNKLGRDFHSWNFLSWPLSECIEFLNISDNSMRYFPVSLVRFRKLKVLKLSNITAKKIPFGICLLSNLQDLDLSKNSISALPATIKKRIRKFDKLDISDNELNPVKQNGICPSQSEELHSYIPSLLELSIRSTVENRVYYNELILPRDLVPMLDNVKLCSCGKICAKSFGTVYTSVEAKLLANTFIASHHINLVPMAYESCCPQHKYLKTVSQI